MKLAVMTTDDQNLAPRDVVRGVGVLKAWRATDAAYARQATDRVLSTVRSFHSAGKS